MDRLQILWVARSELTPEAGVKSHSHPYYHMFHVQAGSIHLTVGGKDYILSPGHTLLVPPQVEHGYTNKTQLHAEYLEVKFAAAQPSAEESQVHASDDPLVTALIRQILKEYSDLGNLADDAAAAYLNALLNALGQKQRYQKQPQQFHHLDATGYSELSQKVIHYLEDHYNEDLSLDSLAQAMDYNKSYLCVAFKKDTQQTILDCLNTIRIRKAAELIVYSDHSLSQVSELCGFASVSHFNRVFLKYAGITPGQCRRAYPADILFGFHGKSESLRAQSGYFMYSVLAQKRITLDMINELDRLEKQQDQ